MTSYLPNGLLTPSLTVTNTSAYTSAAASAHGDALRRPALHCRRPKALLMLPALTGSERFHGRGLSLRLCPGLAAPFASNSCRGQKMSLLLSERLVDLPAEIVQAESDSDSGVGSPMEEAVTDSTPAEVHAEEAQDSDDDIVVSRKPRSRKVLQDSDSEKEEDTDGMPEALVLSESSGEGTKASESEQPKKSRGKIISRIAVASDDGEMDETRKKEKSQRRKEKEKRRGALVKQLKEKIRTPEESTLPKVFNDSGCLLGDNDLFDAQLEEDDMTEEVMEEEESLDAIRAAMKKKAKNQPHFGDSDEDEEQEGKSQRKERKAARASKEAMKQLHSESQRIVRESTIGLPYHMPEPKGIDQFFKRRARPDKPAMSLLKSAKYKDCMREASSASSTTQNQSEAPEPNSNPQADQDEPDPVTCTQQDGDTDELDAQSAAAAVIVSTEDQSGVAGVELKNPEVMEDEGALPSVSVSESDESPKEDRAMSPVQQSKSVMENSEQRSSALIEPKPKKDKLARLRELGLEPPPVAKLCADEGAFIQLEPQQANPGLEALKERFLRHIQSAPRPKGERSINVNVVRKDSTSSGQEELHAESITVTVNEEEEEATRTKPGEKLVLLKSRLQQAMAIRRKEERERRAALHRLDNEDCEEEEEEEEMTESEEEEGIDDLLGDGDDGEEANEEEAEEAERGNTSKRSASPAFKSPSPTPYTDGTLMLFAGSSCSRTGDGVRQSGQGNQENDGKMEDEDGLSLNKDNSHNSSFELTSSTLPSYQPVSRAAGKGLSTAVFRSPSPCFFRPSFLGSASKSSGKLSEPSLTLPVEDSQDLYGVPSPEIADSQGPFSQEEDTQSQLLDADGFLNVGPRGGQSRSHKRQLLLDNLDENAMDANMGELLGFCSGGFGSAEQSQPAGEDELLGLCSGVFSTQAVETSKPKKETEAMETEHTVEESHGSSDTDMDQLLSLCSGKFTGSPAMSPGRPGTRLSIEEDSDSKSKVVEEEEGEEEEDNCEFRLLSDVDSNSEKEECEEESDVEGEMGDEEEQEEREAVFGPRPGKKIRMTDFVESEAELSGSDVGSEDEDDEGGDEYEEDELQEQLPSDDELMDQVNKIHMKHVLDEDKRKLRLYQERYLADGDLHSDGPGRERRFRWKNIDDGFELGIGAEGEGEEEEEDDVDQQELQRHKERLEREQWIREQSETSKKGKEVEEEEEKIGEEDSQFMKLAKKLTAKALQKKETSSVPVQEKPVSNANPFLKPSKPVVKRGSLLSQPRAVLQKLANISEGNPLAPRNTRGFLFQTLSPEKETPTSANPKKQIKKRAQTDTLAPVAKRPCRENSVKSVGPPRSIFSFFEN
ncbi:claspin isoform X2 [Clarias magur]|uniref:Claspin isoform X2 n=1 Tax=Clarias magur TaxID=1594786 RepID=A0A8J4WRE6_CLAMG|nr:claspin isoform X2 [Clarias magur]